MADGITVQTAALTAVTNATGWLLINQGQGFGTVISGTGITADVQLQYRTDANGPIVVVKTYSLSASAGVAELNLISHVVGEVRLICSAFTGATGAAMRIAPGAYMGR